jgi:hypothetical protein
MVPTTSPKPVMASSLKSQRIVESNSLNISESKDHQFQFFEKKTQNQTTINSSYVKNLKEPLVFRKESHGSLLGSLTFFLRTTFIIPKPVLRILGEKLTSK